MPPLAMELRDEYQSEAASLTAIAGKLGCSPDSLRVWTRQVQRDGGERPGQTSAEEDEKTVRGTVFSTNAIQTCLTMKVLFGMALRQTTGFVKSLLRLIDLDWAVPNFSTLSRRQKTLKVNIPFRGSQGPLHLLIDSTGIKVEGEGEWSEYPSCARPFWHPEPVSLDQRIGGFKELSHDCDDGDFGGFPGLAERGVFNLEVGVETHGNQGWHVEGIAQRFAPAAE